MKLEHIDKKVIELTIAVLRTPDLHYKSCFTDISGRPNPDERCRCPIKGIVKHLNLYLEFPLKKTK